MSLLWALGFSAVMAQEPGAARELLGEIEGYDTQISSLTLQLDTLEKTLVEADAERDRKLREATEADAALGSRRSGVGNLLRALYRIHKFGMLRLLFGAEDPIELRRRAHYLSSVIAADERKNAEFAQLSHEKRAAAEAAEAAGMATRTLRDQLAAKRESLRLERKEQVRWLADIRRVPSYTHQAVAETASAKARFEESVGQREAQAPPQLTGNETEAFRKLRGQLARPVSGRLIRGFGPYVDAISGQRITSLGIDWAAGPGTPFRAVAAGTVTRAGYVRGYGQVVMLQHGAFATLYAHANGLRVVIDQAVRAGDTLGTVGTTGLIEEGEERLHFEIRYNGTPQDPQGWLAP